MNSIDAVDKGDLSTVKQWIAIGNDVNTPGNEQRQTLLHHTQKQHNN